MNTKVLQEQMGRHGSLTLGNALGAHSISQETAKLPTMYIHFLA